MVIDGDNGLTFTNATTQKSGGRILQVISSTKTDTWSVAGAASWNDITGLSVTITPYFSTSKFLIISSITIGANAGLAGLSVRFLRNSTVIDVGDAAGVRPQATGSFYPGDSAGAASASSIGVNYLDSPATSSAITYKLQGASSTASTVYVNRTVRDTNGAGFDGRFASTITVMEVAG